LFTFGAKIIKNKYLMKKREVPITDRKTARIAGLWYLANILFCVFAIMYVDEKLSVAGDAAATIESFRANGVLFGFGLVACIAGFVCFVLMAGALCRLFKPVDNRLTRLMMAFTLAGAAIAIICKLAQTVATAVPAIEPQSNTAGTLLSFYTNGGMANEIFYGLWLLPLGLLILKSDLIPKIIGILLLVTRVCHLIDFGTFFFAPGVSATVQPVLYAGETGEFVFVLWLLIKCVETREQRDRLMTVVTMKAVICTKYGAPEVLKIDSVEKPAPKDNEVLIKVYATTVHVGDTRIRKADIFPVRLVFGLFKPGKKRILGMELSGEIESVGKRVTLFKKGDKVFAYTGFGLGAYAEYKCMPEKSKALGRKGFVALKPENLSCQEAAAVPAGGITALKNLQKAHIGKGQKILINGASGSLGTFAIQLAKYYGAEVTAVCSEKNFERVKSVGADKVIDYTKTDFTKSAEKYDIVYDAVVKSKHSACKNILKKDGFFLNNSRLPAMEEKDILLLKELIESNKLKPVIDRTYSIDAIVEAHRYVDTGRKKGNVVVKIASSR
jgi:NADPH:quinone reductase-like Zn-dependent oxidoreductase